jgi:hypothetical protein
VWQSSSSFPSSVSLCVSVCEGNTLHLTVAYRARLNKQPGGRAYVALSKLCSFTGWSHASGSVEKETVHAFSLIYLTLRSSCWWCLVCDCV